MANPLLNIFGAMSNGGSNIFFKIAGAMMRGESPVEFAQNLARTVPALQGMDLTDLKAAAHKLCQERGIDEAKLTAEIKQSVANMK